MTLSRIERNMETKILLKRIAITLAYYAADCFIPVKAAKASAASAKKALIVRLDNIGDFILWRNAAQLLIAHLQKQGYEVSLAVNEAWADLAETSLKADHLLTIKVRDLSRSFSYRLTIRRLLATAQYDLAINPVVSRELLFSDSLIRASHAAQKIGCVGDSANLSRLEKFFADPIYTQLIDITQSAQHELIKNRQFLTALKIPGRLGLRPALAMEKRFSGPERLPDNYVVMAIGASWIGKKWPAQRFKLLSEWLTAQYGLTTVIIGGAEDREFGEQLHSATAINLCGLTALLELPSVMRNAKLVISNDSAAIHFAFAAGVKAIGILGGGHFGRFLPYPQEIADGAPLPQALYTPMDCFGCGWTCRYSRAVDEPVRCIDLITLENVQQAVMAMLDAPSADDRH